MLNDFAKCLNNSSNWTSLDIKQWYYSGHSDNDKRVPLCEKRLIKPELWIYEKGFKYYVVVKSLLRNYMRILGGSKSVSKGYIFNVILCIL